MKTCENCGVPFSQPVNRSLKEWEKQRFCSQSCAKIMMWKINPPQLPTGERHHGAISRKLRLAQTEPKSCKWCNSLFSPNEKTKWSEWERKLFCSIQCSSSFCGQTHPTGKDNPVWKGGKSSLNEKIRKLPIYIALRSECFHRDKYTCQTCGATGTYLNADHIKALSVIIEEYNLKTLKDARNCPALWDITNLRTLCLPCHTATETYGRKRVLGTVHRIPSQIIN